MKKINWRKVKKEFTEWINNYNYHCEWEDYEKIKSLVQKQLKEKHEKS